MPNVYKPTGRPVGRPKVVYVRKEIGFPRDVHDRIEELRAESGRDFSGEVIAQLRTTTRVDSPPPDGAR